MILNFKEIPQAHRGGGLQDSWELFCREFLLTIGYVILEDPSRGADGGLDLKVKLDTNDSRTIWLVSCKHKAHSGMSVTHADELNIRDRVESKQCNGFIGFYSTLPSSGLLNVLEGLGATTPYMIFDYEKIERFIVGFHSRERLFFRFFPESYKRFKEIYYFNEPVKLFLSYFQMSSRSIMTCIKYYFMKLKIYYPM